MFNMTKKAFPPGFQPDKGHKVFARLAGILLFGSVSALFLIFGVDGAVTGSIDIRGKTGSILYRAFRDGDYELAYWIYTTLAIAAGAFFLVLSIWSAFARIPEPYHPRD
jgi:dihydrodipicolinate synthase/N-acetylneuraminate lyase